MESATRLDYALFHLTPTRTRCDLVIFSGKLNEKLAYGLFEPFSLHLQSAKDQIAKGGYSITLRPAPATGNVSWFTKGTLQRFVRFVSTPEVLERVVTIEREIQQIDDSIQSYEASNAVDTDGLNNNFKSDASYKSKGEYNDNGRQDGSPQENSKARLQRVLDTRKAFLRKEQAMACARALAAGYEIYNLDDLLSFADAFGASRLRDACISFIDLCKKKNEDRLWMDEIAAMQALPQPDFSYFGTSGIVLAGEDNIHGGKPTIDTSTSYSSASRGSSDINADQIPSTDGKAQIPFPWASQLHYMQNFQAYQSVPPPFQGYVFPGMQVPPPYYPNNMQWPPNANTALGSDREPDDHHIRKSSSKNKNRKRSEKVQHSGDSDPSDFSTGSDSSTDRQKKKHEKKSSRRVVIRNINYITSNNNGEKNGSSEESLTDDDYHKNNHRRRKNGIKHNGEVHGSSDNENKKGIRGNENWDAFQQLLLREDSESNESRTIQVEEGYHTTKRPEKQMSMASDAFLISGRDRSNESNLGNVSIQSFEASESIRNISRKGNNPEEFMMYHRNEEDYYSQVTASDGASHSSIIKGRGGDDWIVGKMSGEAPNNTSIDIGMIDGMYALRNDRDDKFKNDINDDSVMIQARPMDNNFDCQLRFDMDMVSEAVGKGLLEETPGKSEATAIPEPEELLMVLDRSASVDYPVASWTPEMDFENNVVLIEASKKQSDVDVSVDKLITSNAKDGNKKIRPASTRDAKSRLSGRSTSDLASKTSRPAWGSRAAANKSKLQKEEESRKRMEELALQRQKRIAERSATNFVSTKKISSTVNRTKSGSLTEKSKLPSPNEETKKMQKPVLKSSTIDRLAAAKTVQNEPVISSKSTQAKKEVSKLKSVKASSLSRKSTPADVKKPKYTPSKMKSSDENSEAKDLNGIHRSISDASQVKEAPAESPSELMTAEDIHVQDIQDTHVPSIVTEPEDIKELHITSLTDKHDFANETDIKEQSSEVDDLPKPAVDSKSSTCQVQNEELMKVSSPVPEPPTELLNASADIEENVGKFNTTPSYREISEIEESTPPTREVSADPIISRKKWITTEHPPKAAKGFRKLLMFGRRRIQYA